MQLLFSCININTKQSLLYIIEVQFRAVFRLSVLRRLCKLSLTTKAYMPPARKQGGGGAAVPVKSGSRGLRPPKICVNGACKQGVKKPSASLSDSRSSTVVHGKAQKRIESPASEMQTTSVEWTNQKAPIGF